MTGRFGKDTTIAEIEAVCKLGSEADRHALLKQIAGRPHLSPPAQVHLAKVASDRLGIEANREDVLRWQAVDSLT